MGSKSSRCIGATDGIYSPDSCREGVNGLVDERVNADLRAKNDSTCHIDQSHLANTVTSSVGSSIEQGSAFDQLMMKCENGDLEGIVSLVDHCKELELTINDSKYCVISDTKMYLNPLQLAAANGFYDIVKYLLQFHHVSPNIADPSFGMTALHLAVYMGHIHVIETLCKDHRVDLREKNFDGKTALFLAIEKGYANAVECIFRFRPRLDIKLKDFDGNTLLHGAATFPNERIMMMVMQYIVSNEYSILDSSEDQNFMERVNSNVRQFIETPNFQGESALDILNRLIKTLRESSQKLNGLNTVERSSTASSNDHEYFDGKMTLYSFSEQQRKDAIEIALNCLRIVDLSVHEILSPIEDQRRKYHHSRAHSIDSDTNSERTIGPAAFSWSPQNEGLLLHAMPKSPLLIQMD